MRSDGQWLVWSAILGCLLWGAPSLAAEEVTERALPNAPLMQTTPLSPSMQKTPVPGPTLDQTVALLQQQVQTLAAQVAALQSVLKVTSTGATLQAPTLSLLSLEGTTIRSGKAIIVDAGTSIDTRSSTSTSIRAGSTALLEAAAGLDLKGSLIKHNGGNRPLATVGSAIGNGQVLNGSATILGN